jgi:putative nucleotidyltransferase with HDIG domain
VSSSLERGESAIAEDGEFQAIMDLGQCAILKEWRKINELLQERQKLELIRELLVTMDISSQMDIITRRLPVLGIKSGYLSLYKDNPLRKNEESTCLLGFQGNQRILIGTEGISFPSRKLVPDDFLSNHGQRMIIVEALKNFGFIVFEMGAKPTGYFALLSDIISGTLEGALLFKELENQKNDLSVNLEHMRKAMAGFIQTMSATVEMRDPYTAGHQRRVSDLARTIAQEMALAPAQIEGIRMAGILHDLGKIYIPAEILNRAGVLDDIERSMIKRHPKVAFDILNNIEFPWPIANIVYQHHERMNGKGYPRGIKGASIIMEARILAVADVVEAMSSHRPYRESLGIKKALEEINKNTGVLYDPQVVDICTKLFREKGYKFKSEYLIPAVK